MVKKKTMISFRGVFCRYMSWHFFFSSNIRLLKLGSFRWKALAPFFLFFRLRRSHSNQKSSGGMWWDRKMVWDLGGGPKALQKNAFEEYELYNYILNYHHYSWMTVVFNLSNAMHLQIVQNRIFSSVVARATTILWPVWLGSYISPMLGQVDEKRCLACDVSAVHRDGKNMGL